MQFRYRRKQSSQETTMVISKASNLKTQKKCRDAKNKKTVTHQSQKIDMVVAKATMERAEEVLANLDSEFPSFKKLMMRSHVVHGFWLGLPSNFCSDHLPNVDEDVYLVDENGRSQKTNYLSDKKGLSGGWRRFSLDHRLEEGDVCVFQLTKHCLFKVYIVKGSSTFTELDGALSLLSFDSGNSSETMELTTNLLSLDSGNSSESMELTTNSSIINEANDLNLSSDIREKYYRLCKSQNTILHEKLTQCQYNGSLITSVIYETMDIVDAIRAAAKSSTIPSVDDLETWDGKLKGFEHLGMVVGFVRARIHKLMSLSESEDFIELKKKQRYEAIQEMKSHIRIVGNIRDVLRGLDAEISNEKKKLDIVYEEGSTSSSFPW